MNWSNLLSGAIGAVLGGLLAIVASLMSDTELRSRINQLKDLMEQWYEKTDWVTERSVQQERYDAIMPFMEYVNLSIRAHMNDQPLPAEETPPDLLIDEDPPASADQLSNAYADQGSVNATRTSAVLGDGSADHPLGTSSSAPPFPVGDEVRSGPVELAVRHVRHQHRRQDQFGEPVTVKGTGTLARCLQHETDHVNGIVMEDRLSASERRDLRRQHRRVAPDYPDDWPASPR